MVATNNARIQPRYIGWRTGLTFTEMTEQITQNISISVSGGPQ